MRPERIIQTAIVVAGIGGFIALLSLNLPKSQAKLVIVLGTLTLIALFWGTSVLFDRKRRREIGEALSRRGLAVGQGPEARFVHRLEKGQRNLEGKFWAEGTDRQGLLEVAEFTYQTGRGKHTQTHRNMQVMRPAPERWPTLRLTKRPGFMSRPVSHLGSAEDYGLENEAFGRRWSLECADRDFVVLLLSPLIQDWLMLAPKDESWTIAEGRVCLTRKRRCYAEDVEAMTARLDELLAMMPEELAGYESGRVGES